MARQLQLTIPTPCHENWDGMSPSEKGRFCGSCQKQVIDFSNMSDRQVAQFFKKPSTGSICGRFMSDQLDRAIEIPKKRIPWFKYFFQFALPAFLVSAKVAAQGNVRVVTPPKAQKSAPFLKRDTILLPEVVVVGFSVQSSQVDIKKADFIGSCLKGKVMGPVITPSVPVPQTSDIPKKRDLSQVFGYTFPDTSIKIRLGGVSAIISKRKYKQLPVIKSEPINKTIPVMNEVFSDPSQHLFKIFPNPVSSGNAINISFKELAEGYYSFQLLNLGGQTIKQEEIWIDTEARILNIDLPTLAGGSYFLILTNKKTGKKYSEKIIVQ